MRRGSASRSISTRSLKSFRIGASTRLRNRLRQEVRMSMQRAGLAMLLAMTMMGPNSALGTTPSATTTASGRYIHPHWGVNFVVPDQWFVTDRKVVLLVASKTQPGLIIVRFAPKTSLEKMRQGYAEGVSEEGLQ